MHYQIFRSSDANVSKFVFEKEAGALDSIAVEAVLYRYNSYSERTVVCCSTQCGCPVGCTFCGTGKFFIRSLTADEIVEQVVFSKEEPPAFSCYTASIVMCYQRIESSLKHLRYLHDKARHDPDKDKVYREIIDMKDEAMASIRDAQVSANQTIGEARNFFRGLIS